ncbi:alpha-ribazole phosphatase [Burkholderia glumae]|uniref:alpha-ribazole phosphatase n=1 Tax=Burkholderia glumae TaxID=337 RepID=UPI000F600EEC|nr:alpha-ribazole phosphatase [Burkholderia glumae]MCM2548637.1 alpha-ribazole phosphatase [Burkholderia glumae]MCQ0029267.1 alpha-ribazole phosphatase [Burkholderia glumae]MCQ0039182.1 alpha-ribazole phosphatase [Burkholderia glumae]NVE23782.1 alpha-ribazole phosphatase [Burkholderia glumae]QGA36885.1 alpha-ribazole phosphatase [Burkholderia glumae]
MDVVLIRHPAPAVAGGVCYGATDLPLAGDAAAAAAELAGRLRADGLALPDRIVTSPLRRCAAVAEALGALLQVTVCSEPRLREIDFGGWEMRTWDEIGPAALDRWQADLMGAREHGGESAAQFVARVVPAAASLERRAGAPPVIAITHAGVIRALASHWLGVPLASLLARPIAYGGRVGFARDARGWHLRRWDEPAG